ncbi:MAG: VOC family protein [Chloroflexota bacterium]|nr:VOC family protein [Chloroflexota bacterium]
MSDLGRTTPFWSALLGYPLQRPITQFMVLRPERPEDHRPHLILQQVPEAKVGKNRAHLDLFFPSRGEARQRVLALGGRLLQEETNCIGSHCWYLMADPEGNEFCVVGD